MDEKVREIEERLQHPMFLKEPGKHLQSGQARDDIKYLLTRIKELEYIMTSDPDHWDGAFVKWATEREEARIKELEENNEGLRDALNLRKGALVQATNGIKRLNERIKELVEGIEKVLQWRNFDGDGITDPLRMELHKLIEK